MGGTRWVLLAAAAASGVVAQDVESVLLSRMSRSLVQFPCTRLINMTAGPNGVTGFLYLVQTTDELTSFHALNDNTPRIAVLAPALSDDQTDAIRGMSSLPWLAGIIMLPGPLSEDGFSPEVKKLPRGFSPAWVWNSQGLGLLAERFKFPIVALQAEEAANIIAMAQFNLGQSNYGSYPQHAVHMSFYMGPDAMTSASCLDAQSCLPLGGQSVWGSLGPLDAAPPPHGGGSPRPQRPIVMVACPLDSSAMFHDLAFGADSAASSIVATLAAAVALAAFQDVEGLPLQILFGLFQAEQWGRIGSRRWLWEVEQFACSANINATSSPNGRAYCASPLRSDLTFASLALRDFAFVLAVDQVGRPGLQNLYVHEFDRRPEPTNATFGVFNATLAGAPGLPAGFSIQQAGTTAAPPPTSLISWQDQGSGPLAIDGAVLSEYDTEFQSLFYHSEFDNGSRVDAASVTAAATVIARGIYALATNISDWEAAALAVPPGLAANATLVADLLGCITVQARCALFGSLLGVDNATLATLVPDGPLSLYTGVYNQPYVLSSGGYVLQPKPLEAAARNLLAYASALPSGRNGTCNTTADCTARMGNVAECILGECLIANAFYHDALSPAVLIGDSNGEFSIDNDLLTSEDRGWVEPYWSARIGATVFLKDSVATEGGVLAVGLLTVASSLAGTWYLVRFLDTWYRVP